METGLIATLVIGSLLTTGAVVGFAATNGDMMQGMMANGHAGGMHHSTGNGMMHDHDEHEECEDHMGESEHESCQDHEAECEWGHEYDEMVEECEEHVEQEHSHEDDDHCGMMG